MQISNLSGHVAINASNTFRDAAAHLFEIVNDTETLNASITSSTFRHELLLDSHRRRPADRRARSAAVNLFVGGSRTRRGTGLQFSLQRQRDGRELPVRFRTTNLGTIAVTDRLLNDSRSP